MAEVLLEGADQLQSRVETQVPRQHVPQECVPGPRFELSDKVKASLKNRKRGWQVAPSAFRLSPQGTTSSVNHSVGSSRPSPAARALR